MKSNLYKNLIFIFGVTAFLYSCNLNNSSTVSTSDDATITSFVINSNDSSTASSAVFTITNAYTIDSIYNLDSLPYNTRVDSLIPTIAFESSDGYIVNDTLTYNYYSTISAIDFSRKVKITNVASDGKTKKQYVVDLRVHKIDPYHYVWTKLSGQISANVYENQKALFFNNKLHFFTGSGVINYLYTSSDGKSWQQNIVNGLPLNVSFTNSIEVLNNKLILCYGADIYTSSNGTDWSKLTTDNKYTYKSLLCQFQSKLYAVGQNISNGNYSIINSADGSNWDEISALPTGFPVSGFASTTFTPKYGNSKALVVGGFDVDGKILNTRWSTEDGIYWTNLKNAKSTFAPVAYPAVVYYGSRLLLVDDYYSYSTKKFIRNSLDYGLTWAKADTTQNRPDNMYLVRQKGSAVINPNTQTMYIIGGINNNEDITTVLSDVWEVKVNYYKFKPQDWYKY